VLCVTTDQAGECGESQKTDKDSMKSGVRKETDKRRTLRGITKAVSLAAKLSPKSQRKDKGLSNIAELKVCVYTLEILPCHLTNRTISYVNSVVDIRPLIELYPKYIIIPV